MRRGPLHATQELAKDIGLAAGTQRELKRLAEMGKIDPAVHLDFQSLLELTR